MNVYFVRHGETVANAKDVFQSDDDALTDKGLRQADFVADRLSRLPIEALYSSDISRARQTSERVSKALGLDAEYSPLFRERKEPTSLTGLSFSDPKIPEVRALRDSHIHDPRWRYEDEENIADTVKRCEQALTHLRESGKEHVAVVTHGVFVRFLFGVAVFREAYTPEIWLKLRFGLWTLNTGISILQYGAKNVAPEWSVLTWNDHAHLG